jgi:hypothetical protein
MGMVNGSHRERLNGGEGGKVDILFPLTATEEAAGKQATHYGQRDAQQEQEEQKQELVAVLGVNRADVMGNAAPSHGGHHCASRNDR